MRKYLTQNNLFILIALIAFAFGIYFGVSKSYEPSKWAFITAIASLLFANLDRFRRFKLDKSGIEAETREVVKEAKSTIKELQDLSKIMASTILGLVKRSGRWGGYSYDEKEKVKNETLGVLERLRISDEDVETVVAKSKWHEFTELDYVHHILGGSYIPQALPDSRIPEWKELRHRSVDNLPKPDELVEFLRKCSLLSDDAKELIKDYEYYIKHRKQRRLEVWKNREKWSHLQKQDI